MNVRTSLNQRWIVALSLVSALCCLNAAPALACLPMPRYLARPHTAVIDEAKQIFWAEVIGSSQLIIKRVEKARKWVRYKLKVLRVLKGEARSTIDVDGEGDLSGIWDTTFNNHTEDGFWKRSSGRMGVYANCSMVPPHFHRGKAVLGRVELAGTDYDRGYPKRPGMVGEVLALRRARRDATLRAMCSAP